MGIHPSIQSEKILKNNNSPILIFVLKTQVHFCAKVLVIPIRKQVRPTPKNKCTINELFIEFKREAEYNVFTLPH